MSWHAYIALILLVIVVGSVLRAIWEERHR